MIFIDGQHGANDFGVHVDNIKLVSVLSDGRRLKRAYYYGSIPLNPDNDDALQEQIGKQMA